MGDGVSHDAFSEPSGSHTGTFSWTHTPDSAPAGVLVFVMRIDGDSTDAISGVTYGGVSMTAVTGGLARDTSGESGLCKAYVLESSVPTGAKTVQVTTTAGNYYASAITVACAGGDIRVAGVVLLQEDGTLSEQSIDDGTPGIPSVRYAAGYTGLNSPPSVGANSTSLQSIDDGTMCVVTCRETTAGQGSRPVGFSSATTDDRAFVHLAVKEFVH